MERFSIQHGVTIPVRFDYLLLFTWRRVRCFIIFIIFMCVVPSIRAEIRCAGCPAESDSTQLRQLRIEATKRLILDRLDLEDRPSKTNTTGRIPLTVLNLIRGEEVHEEEQRSDFREIRQLLLFPTKIWPPKHHSPSHRSLEAHLKFHITPEMRLMSLQSAVLWTARPVPDDLKASTNATEVRWHSQDLTETINDQIDQRINRRFLTIDVDTTFVPMEQINQNKPYLVVQIDSHRQRSKNQVKSSDPTRRKRSTPACSSTVTQCCRESLHVSFKDIGWDDWILAPHGFNAYYCRGSCRTSTAAASSASQHAAVLQKLLSRDRLSSETRSQLSPCCAPTRFSPLTVFYTETDSDVIKQRVLPNMIVESCGCAL